MTIKEIKEKLQEATSGQKDVPYINNGAINEILNAICDALDAIPAPVEVPDWVKGVPVIEELNVPLTPEQYDVLTNSAAVVYDGILYTLCTELHTVSGCVKINHGTEGTLFVNRFVVDDGDALSTVMGLLVYYDGQDSYTVISFEF